MSKARLERNALLELTKISMIACRRHMASYSCPKSKHLYTQAQLTTCLILKSRLKQTYRGIVELLAVSDGLREAMGLEKVPRHTALAEFEKRAMTPQLPDGLIGQVLQLCREKGLLQVDELAVDSTGVECSPASRHYEMRIGRKRSRYVELTVAVACTSILAVSAAASIGPSNDCGDDAKWVLWHGSGRCRPYASYLDSGFDAERHHRFFREGMGCVSFIPPAPKTADGSVKSECRSQCVTPPASYGRRWHSESFFSGLKRVCGNAVRARGTDAMIREAMLKPTRCSVRQHPCGVHVLDRAAGRP